MPGPAPKVDVVLTDDDAKRLDLIIRSPTFQYRVVVRAKIIVHAAAGVGNTVIAHKLMVTRRVAMKWRKRFAEHGIAGLMDLPRAGRPPTLSAIDRHEISAMACHSPEDYGLQRTNWTIETLREAAMASQRVSPLSDTSVWKILNEADLKPHKFKMWLFSKGPQFEEKMHDIVRLYLEGPEDGGVVVCVDEKTSIQVLERKVRTLPGVPGRETRMEFEYIRHGTSCLFAAFEVKSGRVFGWTNPTRTSPDFLFFMDQLAERYPEGKVHVVLDNLNIHKGEAVAKWNERHEGRFMFHYTPTHASWLNQIEIWFGILSRQRLKRASFRSTKELRQAILDYIEDRNEHYARPFEWTFKGYPLREGSDDVAFPASMAHTGTDDDRPREILQGRSAQEAATRPRVHPWTPVPQQREINDAVPGDDHRARRSSTDGRQSPYNPPPRKSVQPLGAASYRPVGMNPLRRKSRRTRTRRRGNNATHGGSLAGVARANVQGP